MKLTSPVAKALIARFQGVKLGQPCVFPTPLPGLSSEAAQAILTERTYDEATKKGYWQFALYWHGCFLTDVIAEASPDGELILEAL